VKIRVRLCPILIRARQPGAYVWLMVILKMIKEFTNQEALIIYPDQIKNSVPLLDLLDADICGQRFNDGEDLLKLLLRFIQDFAQRAIAIGLIEPDIDVILSLQVGRPGGRRFWFAALGRLQTGDQPVVPTAR
jgi:hypothetical protein